MKKSVEKDLLAELLQEFGLRQKNYQETYWQELIQISAKSFTVPVNESEEKLHEQQMKKIAKRIFLKCFSKTRGLLNIEDAERFLSKNGGREIELESIPNNVLRLTKICFETEGDRNPEVQMNEDYWGVQVAYATSEQMEKWNVAFKKNFSKQEKLQSMFDEEQEKKIVREKAEQFLLEVKKEIQESKTLKDFQKQATELFYQQIKFNKTR